MLNIHFHLDRLNGEIWWNLLLNFGILSDYKTTIRNKLPLFPPKLKN